MWISCSDLLHVLGVLRSSHERKFTLVTTPVHQSVLSRENRVMMYLLLGGGNMEAGQSPSLLDPVCVLEAQACLLLAQPLDRLVTRRCYHFDLRRTSNADLGSFAGLPK